MNNVMFGNYHSFNDFSLILINKTIEQPEPKTEYVEIPGANEPLDLTEYFGDIKYSNRQLIFEFETTLRHQAFYELVGVITNALNGKRFNIVLDEEKTFYFEGRVKVNEYKSSEKIGMIVIEADCNPYKLESYETIKSYILNGTQQIIILENLRKRVVPSIIVETTSSVNLNFNNISQSLSSGTFTIPELELVEGANYITLTGEGTITFKYRRGKL